MFTLFNQQQKFAEKEHTLAWKDNKSPENEHGFVEKEPNFFERDNNIAGKEHGVTEI